jgi:hypothetical protein
MIPFNDFRKPMAFEFDHLFILTDVGATVGDRLVTLGLTEGSANVHPGQGTANRRFFFHNAMMELLWVHDAVEAQSELIRRSGLWGRWAGRNVGACPFGICLRSSDEAIAFPYWDFCPPYLPPSLSIAVGENSEILTEPMVFQTPFGKRPDQAAAEKLQPLGHAIGWREITRVTLIMPEGNPPSAAWQAVLATGQVQMVQGAEYCLELGFDGETQGEQWDDRPELPLVCCW